MQFNYLILRVFLIYITYARLYKFNNEQLYIHKLLLLLLLLFTFVDNQNILILKNFTLFEINFKIKILI